MAVVNCSVNYGPHCCRSRTQNADNRTGYRYFEPRRFRRGTIYIKSFANSVESLSRTHKRQTSYHRRIRITEKLATSREQAKRFLRSVISSNPSADRSHSPDPPSYEITASRRRESSTTRSSRDTGQSTVHREDTNSMRAGIRGSISGPVSGMVSRPSLVDDVRQFRNGSSGDSFRSGSVSHVMPGTDPNDKPLASGSGVQVSINLAEPVLFLQGFDQSDTSQGNTAMLRGTLHLRVTKSSKLKAVTLKFKGRAMTKWPEGMFCQSHPSIAHLDSFDNRYSSSQNRV